MGQGKARRLGRVVRREDGRTVILPLDGVLVAGCLAGAEDLTALVGRADRGATDAVMIRYGEARRLAEALSPDVGLIVRLSGACDDGPDPTFEELTNSVRAAAAIGADAVCATLKLGSPRENDALRGVGHVAEECDRLGMAFLCEAYALDADGAAQIVGERPARAARIAQELGADLVKIANPGAADEMRFIASWCQIPIVVAGGERITPPEVAASVTSAIEGGAAGVAIGRNVISYPDPPIMQTMIANLVHGGWSADDAVASLEARSAVS